MSLTVLLDSAPLGLVTNPKASPTSMACNQWLTDLTMAGAQVIIPEIIDYEVRRELLRGGKTKGIAQLDRMQSVYRYLPLTTAAMRQAAEFWADARKHGRPTAGDNTIDCDMILAAQLVTLGDPGAILATTNVAHLSHYVPAELWQNVKP